MNWREPLHVSVARGNAGRSGVFDDRAFVAESNRIERIYREPTSEELAEHDRFTSLPVLTLDEVVRFVAVYQPDARLRIRSGLNATVGNHIPPMGGPGVGYALEEILAEANESTSPYQVHVRYEALHPFTDGNGRSGRAIWAWMMEKLHGGYPLGFLHHFYYQALDASRAEELENP